MMVAYVVEMLIEIKDITRINEALEIVDDVRSSNPNIKINIKVTLDKD